MAPASDFSGVTPGQTPQARLKSGLTALQHQQYATAIAQLTPLRESPTAAIRLKAQVGLVKAYMAQGNQSDAIALCHPLTQSKNVQVQTWAKKILANLTKTEQNALDPNGQTGATPEPNHQSIDLHKTDPRTTLPNSGFVPFDSAPEAQSTSTPIQPSTAQASAVEALSTPSSGFIPLAESDRPSSLEPSADMASTTQPIDDASPVDGASPPPQVEASGAIAPEQPSMFHYSYLNHPAGADVPKPRSVPQQPPVSQTPIAPDSADMRGVLPPTDLNQPPPSSSDAPPLAEEDSPQSPTLLADGTWQWVSSERLPAPRALTAVQPFKLWGITAFTVILWFWLIPTTLHRILLTINRLLHQLRWPINPQPISAFYREYHWPIFILLAVSIAASPWLFDYLLKWAYGLKSFSIRGLKTNSPEAVRLIRRVCQQRGWDLPTLKTLPTSIPLCFSYGCWPRFARIVVSQGILDRFSEDEIAALYAYELSHLTRWDWPIMSGLGLCLQGVYLGYWRLAGLGNSLKQPFLQFILGILSSLLYCIYWFVRKVGLWLSRARILAGDRTAVELTGNPNGLIHALIKIAQGIHADIERRGYTDAQLESLDLLTPMSPQTVVGLGSFNQPQTWPRILIWDLTNPYLHWLDFNTVNPALADRFKALTHYAEIWQLTPELGWLSASNLTPDKKKSSLTSYWQPLLLQGAPYFGPLLGFAIAMTLWFIGGVSEAIGFWQIEWFYQDETILYAGVSMGLGIGVLMRINPFFPDLTARTTQTNPPVAYLQAESESLPINSLGVRLQGQLLGRPGLANWLGQDLLLKTDTGLIKLHFSSTLGVPGNAIIPKKKHPVTFIKRYLITIGWFRRGATGWLDIDRLQVKGQPIIHSPHPMVATLVSLGVTLWGIYKIFRGY